MLAKADGVEYVSKGGSSLTVVTRSKTGTINKSDSQQLPSQMSLGPPGTANGLRNRSNGEMKVDDDEYGDQYYYDEVIANLPGGSTPMILGEEVSPEKQTLLGNGGIQSDTALLPPIKGLKAFNGPIGVGGNDKALPSIFKTKTKINPQMMMTPNNQNGVKYPKPEQDMLAKFEDRTLDEDGQPEDFDPILVGGTNKKALPP